MRTHSDLQKPLLINAPSLFSVIVVLLLILSGSGYAQQEANKLFQSGLYQEEAKGDLGAAIQIYQQILKDYSGDRPACAKALLQMGGCYEKLGQTEARKAYERVINEYGDRKEEVAVARERMAQLPVAPKNEVSTPDFRKIKIPTKLPISGSGVLSPDGKKLAFVSEGSIWALPVHGKSSPDLAGTPVRLTESMHAWDVANVSIAWSGNGKWIGFRVAAPKEGQNTEEELYIISAEGDAPKRVPIVWKDWAINVHTLRYALSTDAKMLFFTAGESKEETRIYRMSVEGGEKHAITEPMTRDPALSPDGSKLAYIRFYLRPDGNPMFQEVWMKPLDGGDPILVCRVTGMTWFNSPIWSQDGRRIAFLSSADRGGNRFHQVWVVTLSSNGKPSAPTKFELPGQTSNLLAGWTGDNKIGILIPSTQQVNLFTVPASGGKATQLTTAYTCMPVWAPDGRHIYFDGCHGGERASLEYVAAEGGNVSRIPLLPENLSPSYPSDMAISNDSSTLLFAGFYREGEPKPAGSLFTIPVEGGMVTPLRIDNAEDIHSVKSPQWSPDGSRIAFVAAEEIKPDFSVYNIFVVSTAGGKAKRISSQEDKSVRGTIDWSPDGELIAFYGEDKTLRLIPSNGGESRILVSNVGGDIPWAGITWSPDGKQIAYTAGGDLNVVSLDGGEPVKIKTDLDARHLKIDWSRDGNHIAFAASQGGEPELWLMEDFLPLKTKKTEAAKEPEGIEIKQISELGHGAPSPDGRFVSFMDGETGNVALRDLSTGKKRNLTTEGTWDGPMQFANFSKISPDNKWVAYSWQYVDKGNKFDLRILNIDNPSPRILYDMKEGEVHPAFWLSDNKRLIAYTINTQNKTYQIISVKTYDGSFNVLNTSNKLNGIPSLCLSSDEKHIAFDVLDGGNKGLDIYSIPIGGGPEVPLVEHPANDRTLGWLPGRKELLFLSDRKGTWDIWSLLVIEGKPLGPPKLVFTDIGEIKPIDITRDGTLHFSKFVRKFETNIIPFDAKTNSIEVKSGTTLLGSNYGVEWSPDGQSVAYNREIIEAHRRTTQLFVRDINTGIERQIAGNLETGLASTSWSPKDNTILAFGRDQRNIQDKKYFAGMYKIDATTGRETEILTFARDAFRNPSNIMRMAAEWSLGGNKVFYIKGSQLKHRDLESGQEKTLYEGQRILQHLKRSPIGNELVFLEGKQIMKISGDNGDVKELCSLDNQRALLIGWSSDEKYIYFAANQWLCKLPSIGGAIQKICPHQKGVRFISLSPDEQKIAITTYDQRTEFRKIENLAQEVERIYSQND
ncbi:tetratricopeptide repeat protein [Planctomycetota bacterium]